MAYGARAAWRAQRAQKSCLHSDKPGDGKDAAAKWHPMEAIWRVGTLPLKIAHNSIAASWRIESGSTSSGSGVLGRGGGDGERGRLAGAATAGAASAMGSMRP